MDLKDIKEAFTEGVKWGWCRGFGGGVQRDFGRVAPRQEDIDPMWENYIKDHPQLSDGNGEAEIICPDCNCNKAFWNPLEGCNDCPCGNTWEDE